MIWKKKKKIGKKILVNTDDRVSSSSKTHRKIPAKRLHGSSHYPRSIIFRGRGSAQQSRYSSNNDCSPRASQLISQLRRLLFPRNPHRFRSPQDYRQFLIYNIGWNLFSIRIYSKLLVSSRGNLDRCSFLTANDEFTSVFERHDTILLAAKIRRIKS